MPHVLIKKLIFKSDFIFKTYFCPDCQNLTYKLIINLKGLVGVFRVEIACEDYCASRFL